VFAASGDARDNAVVGFISQLLTHWSTDCLRRNAMSNDDAFIFRQCITLRNGQRICKPKGQAFRIPIKKRRRAEPEAHNDN